VLFAAMCVNIGMWFERFVIIITSVTRTYLPAAWADFSPTLIDVTMFVGTFGFFFMNMLLFLKFGPMLAIAEVKTVMPIAHRGHGKHETEGDGQAEDADPTDTVDYRKADV